MPPGAGDDAVLGGTGTYRVSLTSTITVNSITISDALATLQIANPGGVETISAGFANNGTVGIDEGGGGSQITVGGTLTNTGKISIANTDLSAVTTVSATDLSNSGIINISGYTNRATLSVGAAAPTQLMSGTFELSGKAAVEFGSGTINSIGYNVQISLFGPNAVFENVAQPRSNSALVGLTSISGLLIIYDGSLVISGNLENSGLLEIDNTFQVGGSQVTIGGTLTNSAAIFIGDITLSAATTVSVAGLSNSGSIRIAGGTGTDTNRATLAIGAAAPAVLSGRFDLLGQAVIQFRSGSVGSIANGATLVMDGPDAFLEDAAQPGSNSALSGLANNAGLFFLNDGIAFGFSADFINTGLIAVDESNSFFGTGGSSVSFGGALTNDGTIRVAGGNFPSALTISGAVSGSGTITDIGGIVNFDSAVAAGQTVSFIGLSGTVALAAPSQFAGTIAGFSVGNSTTTPTNVIDLTAIANSTISSANLDTSTDQLSVALSGGGSFAIQLSGTYASGTFVNHIVDVSGNGTELFLSAPICFCRGTMILTDRGEVAVECLGVGDKVKTLSGALKPIVWIGYGRSLVARRNSLARPIIVRRGAFSDNVPARDLYVTHGHAFYFGGVLIPVEHLVNHHSIAWDETARIVEYYHIELEDHDVVFAEGALAETYYDASNRASFQNTRAGSVAGGPKPTYAPILNRGDVVENVWSRLFERAGGCLAENTTDDPDLHLVVDGARLDPATIEDEIFTFTLDRRPTSTLLLCSRSGVPSLLGQGRADHRPLGIAITEIILDNAGFATRFEHDMPQLHEGGCHLPEDGFSWTNGEFELPARFYNCLNGALTLTVHTKRHDIRYPLAALARRAA